MKEDEEGDEEGDISDENDQPEESGRSLDTPSPVLETEVSKDKKRGNNHKSFKRSIMLQTACA